MRAVNGVLEKTDLLLRPRTGRAGLGAEAGVPLKGTLFACPGFLLRLADCPLDAADVVAGLNSPAIPCGVWCCTRTARKSAARLRLDVWRARIIIERAMVTSSTTSVAERGQAVAERYRRPMRCLTITLRALARRGATVSSPSTPRLVADAPGRPSIRPRGFKQVRPDRRRCIGQVHIRHWADSRSMTRCSAWPRISPVRIRCVDG